MDGLKILIWVIAIVVVHELGHILAYWRYKKRFPRMWLENGNILVDCYDVQRANHLFYIAFWGVWAGCVVFVIGALLNVYAINYILVYAITCYYDLQTMYGCLKIVRLYGKNATWKEKGVYVGE